MGERARKIMQLAMHKRESDSNLTKYVTQGDVQVDFHDTQNKSKVLEITPDISYNYVSAQDNANTVVSIAPSKPHDVETSTEASFRNEIEPQAVPDSYTTNVDDSPYDNRVYEVVPTTERQVHLLEILADQTQIDIWSNSRKPSAVNVTVPLRLQEEFEKVLTEQKLYFKLIVEGAQSLVSLANAQKIASSIVSKDQIDFTRYLRYSEDRFWRKTRSRGKHHRGVDPNRNFDYKWNGVGSSTCEKSPVYAGLRPFSEPETISLSKILINNSNHIKLYLSIHSAKKCILYPYGYTKRTPHNITQLHNVAVDARNAMNRVNGNRYVVGNAPTVLNPTSGTSHDWAHAIAGIELSYALELPGGGTKGFDLPENKILGVVVEAFEGIRSFHYNVEQEYAR
ncbi:hypothetical protein FQA39_LY12209 [Lamprigera yunnana]|nr:hypothetical protein FQA39_LY12209 [Lamprigera yunnana]